MKRLLTFSIFLLSILVYNSNAFANSIDAGATEAISNNNNNIVQVETYWTKERMENAIPMDQFESSFDEALTINKSFTNQISEDIKIVSEPVGPNPISVLNATQTVPSTSGKLFFTVDNINYVCSAATINNANKNLIMTAGHCIYDTDKKKWTTNIVFAPAYFEGVTPYGLWEWQLARTFNGWINNADYYYDQAFVTMKPNNNKNLIDVVGGNGLSTGYSQNQTGVTIFGWPAQSPYDGQTAHSCFGNTYKKLLSNDAYMDCGMNGGASGGPWYSAFTNANVGYVFAVTSRRSTTGTPRLYAVPNHQAVEDMFYEM